MKEHISIACLFGWGLNNIFHWKAHLLAISRTELNLVLKLFLSKTFEKSDVSSANILHFNVIMPGSLI